jgi:CBS domain-containing protein
MKRTDITVSDIMTRNVICVHENMSVDAVCALFLDQGISGAPVVDDEGKPVGVVSKTDLLGELPAVLHDPPSRPVATEPGDSLRVRTKAGGAYDLGAGFHMERRPATTVWEVMMPLAFTLPPDAPVIKAAALMYLERIHRVIIVGDDGTVAGIVTALDVAHLFGNPSDFTERRTKWLGSR